MTDKYDVDLIYTYEQLMSHNVPALQERAKLLVKYGKTETSEHITNRTVQAVMAGLLSTSSKELEIDEVSEEAVIEFRQYIKDKGL